MGRAALRLPMANQAFASTSLRIRKQLVGDFLHVLESFNFLSQCEFVPPSQLFLARALKGRERPIDFVIFWRIGHAAKYTGGEVSYRP